MLISIHYTIRGFASAGNPGRRLANRWPAWAFKPESAPCKDGFEYLSSAGNLVNLQVMRLLTGLLSILATVLAAGTLCAGGSELNVIVVVNQNSTNSVQLGNDYCEQRGVPPQNVLRMTGWTNGAIEWSRTDFEALLYNPLLATIASRGLTNQAAYVLLSMDVPYRVADNGSYNSTTSALFYGFKSDSAPPLVCLPGSCALPDASSNSYAFSELPLSEAQPDR